MVNFLDTPVRVGMLGDVHANTPRTIGAVKMAGAQGATHIVQLGDFGWDFSQSFMEPVNKALVDMGIVLGFVDGNHEDFDWLLAQPIDEATGMRQLESNIFHLPRNFRWEWDGVKCLALGGGYSVDKPRRVAMDKYNPSVKSWWPQETITVAEAQKAIDDGVADVMFCHDAPANTEIFGSHRTNQGELFFGTDQIAISEGHRKLLSYVVDEVKPSVFWHGHYHVIHDDPYVRRTDKGTTRVIGLDCDRGTYQDNLVVIDFLGGVNNGYEAVSSSVGTA